MHLNVIHSTSPDINTNRESICANDSELLPCANNGHNKIVSLATADPRKQSTRHSDKRTHELNPQENIIGKFWSTDLLLIEQTYNVLFWSFDDLDQALVDLVKSFGDSIIPDDSVLCGFVVTYPEVAMEGESVDENTSALSNIKTSVGTQIGEGILSDSIYSIAVKFAETHGYGFVDFIADQPHPKPGRKTRNKTKGNFAKIVTSREERTSVVRREVTSPTYQSRNYRKCLSKNIQRKKILEDMARLNSMENIAKEISDIEIGEHSRKVARQIRKTRGKSPVKAHESDLQAEPQAECTQSSVEEEEEIIRSAPLGQYRQYLSKVCEDIYQNKELLRKPKEIKPLEPELNEELSETVGANTREEKGDIHTETIGPRKRIKARRNNNNNIPRYQNKEYDFNSEEELSYEVGIVSSFKRPTSSCPVSSKECNITPDLSTSLAIPTKNMHTDSSRHDLGINSAMLSGNIEIITYNDLQGQFAANEMAASDAESDLHKVDSDQSKTTKMHRACSSPSRTPSVRGSRQKGQTSPSSKGSHAAGSKSIKNDLGVVSCPDLCNGEASADSNKDATRCKESPILQKSPAREAIKMSASEMESGTLTACAQGDMKSPPSLFINLRPQEQGDVEITPKECSDL